MIIERGYFFEMLRTEYLLIQQKHSCDISHIIPNCILIFNQIQHQKQTKTEPYKHKKSSSKLLFTTAFLIVLFIYIIPVPITRNEASDHIF
ncbi:hypothetical protein DB891_10580 [Flavobacterium laiguense]|uniref:Uncharacterized protein n=1 Tax=Flavobacterium laiguense TaxID=2169409 RepID=A0A2U1JVK5_9FLAO|nr:hypothetical protein DB891_10580 [Flavobacterium laiguense]